MSARKEPTYIRLMRRLKPDWHVHFRKVRLDNGGEYLVLGAKRFVPNTREVHDRNVFHLRIDRSRKKVRPLRRFARIGSMMAVMDHREMPEDIQIEAKIETGYEYEE